MKVYLAGAFCPYQKGSEKFLDWRDFVIKGVNNKKIAFYDPRIESDQLCPATFTMDDARGVLNSDILLHYRTKGYEDEGASWEHGIAFAQNLFYQKGIVKKEKLIIYTDDTHAPFPLHFGSAGLTFTNLETSVEFLNMISSIKKSYFMPFYMKLLNNDRIG